MKIRKVLGTVGVTLPLFFLLSHCGGGAGGAGTSGGTSGVTISGSVKGLSSGSASLSAKGVSAAKAVSEVAVSGYDVKCYALDDGKLLGTGKSQADGSYALTGLDASELKDSGSSTGRVVIEAVKGDVEEYSIVEVTPDSTSSYSVEIDPDSSYAAVSCLEKLRSDFGDSSWSWGSAPPKPLSQLSFDPKALFDYHKYLAENVDASTDSGDDIAIMIGAYKASFLAGGLPGGYSKPKDYYSDIIGGKIGETVYSSLVNFLPGFVPTISSAKLGFSGYSTAQGVWAEQQNIAFIQSKDASLAAQFKSDPKVLDAMKKFIEQADDKDALKALVDSSGRCPIVESLKDCSASNPAGCAAFVNPTRAQLAYETLGGFKGDFSSVIVGGKLDPTKVRAQWNLLEKTDITKLTTADDIHKLAALTQGTLTNASAADWINIAKDPGAYAQTFVNNLGDVSLKQAQGGQVNYSNLLSGAGGCVGVADPTTCTQNLTIPTSLPISSAAPSSWTRGALNSCFDSSIASVTVTPAANGFSSTLSGSGGPTSDSFSLNGSLSQAAEGKWLISWTQVRTQVVQQDPFSPPTTTVTKKTASCSDATIQASLINGSCKVQETGLNCNFTISK